jgi:hypothetical protein
MRTISRTVIGLGLVVALSNCTDETVYVEEPIFDDPPEAAQGFLGYDEVEDHLTVCGNCHAGQQSRWENTAHADAWNTLQNSGHSQEFCEGCHTAGPNGNPTEGSVGYAGVQEARYHDVQCESCHGPGLNHVNNPDHEDKPLASIQVLSISGADTTFVGCAECHSGEHHPFVEEWAQSGHAKRESSPMGRAECISCHTAQGALRAWGVNTEYEENDQPLGQMDVIVCATCHDPHSVENAPGTKQLRYPLDARDANINLCIKCHHKRAEPEEEAATTRGPHSPEGPLLLGEAVGWWPPNFEPGVDEIYGTHGSEGNPRLCAGCHVNSYQATDELTGETIYSTGHLFEAIPCLDESGRPVPGDCESLEDRSFASCAGTGCHASEQVARNLMASTTADIMADVHEVDALLDQLPDSLNSRNDGIFMVSDGAWFNARLAELPGSAVHNPFLLRPLMTATIRALEDEYGLQSTRLRANR